MLYSLGTTGVFHIHCMVCNYGGWDMTVVELLMIQTIHLSNLSWDYSDGADPENKSATRLRVFPSFFEYMAAGLCPAQCLAGPSGHITDFLNYIYRRNEYAHMVGTLVPTVQKVVTALVWLAVYGTIVYLFPFRLLYGRTFRESNFLMRVRSLLTFW